MSQTFHEMLNTVKFRGVAGWAHREVDLWPLRDILVGLLFDVQKYGAAAYVNLQRGGLADVAEGSSALNVMFCEMIEADIQTIEAYCKRRGIERRDEGF